jgi:hypothetical protein
MRVAALLPLLLAACGPDRATRADALGGSSEALTPGLVSCLRAIGRPDIAANPYGEMGLGDIEALVACTAERARD